MLVCFDRDVLSPFPVNINHAFLIKTQIGFAYIVHLVLTATAVAMIRIARMVELMITKPLQNDTPRTLADTIFILQRIYGIEFRHHKRWVQACAAWLLPNQWLHAIVPNIKVRTG